MTIRTRRKIFYTLVALFIVLGSGVVLYAQGWRLDFVTWHFEKIGAIYVRAYPENASIYLDSKPVQNQSGFLTPGTLISDLLPRTYNLELKAPGYDTWQENAAVQPSLVTQFKYAVLIPQDGTVASSSVVAAAVSSTPELAAGLKLVAGKNRISVFNIASATTTATAVVPGKNISAAWITGDIVGVLQNDNEFYLYNTSADTVQKLADNVKSFAATSDGSMIAALEYRSLEIFSRTDPTIYYRFNLPDVGNAQRLIWFRDRTHLFIVYPDRVAFLDLADIELINFTTVARGTVPVYDPGANTLYVKNSLNRYMGYQFPS